MRIIERPLNQNIYDALIQQKLSPLLARVIAGRPIPEHTKAEAAITEPKLADLDNPFKMQDMDKAVQRIITAIENGEIIAIETDHDCDGQTAHAVLLTSFRDILNVPKDKLQSFIGHRLQEGYGLSEPLLKRILDSNPRPTLVITADNGSSDEPRIAQLKAAGIDVIVTDHHALPVAGPPASALACLNPTRRDCQFPDPYIAGCMVAWLLMAAVRARMIELGKLSKDAPKMSSVLDYVAVGTVADCVSMARSVNNRAVVKYGLHAINHSTRPCWQAIRPLLRDGIVQSSDLGFTIGPLLNSDGRLSDAFGSVNFLLSNDIQEAVPWAKQLWEQNQQRKAIQKNITQQALQQAQEQVNAGKLSLVIYLPEGHAGVHGISASRVKDAYGRPTIIFSPKNPEPDEFRYPARRASVESTGMDSLVPEDEATRAEHRRRAKVDGRLISGSARSIDDVNIREALQWVADQRPEILQSFGGHKAAAGLTIHEADLATFTECFEQAVQQQIAADAVGPYLMTDGSLTPEQFDLSLVDELRQLEPYGREFDPPQFTGQFTVQNIRLVGQDKTHAQLDLQLPDGNVMRSIWFNACEPGSVPSITAGDEVKAVFSLEDNLFQNRRSLQLQLKYIYTGC